MIVANKDHVAGIKLLIDNASGVEQVKMVNDDRYNALIVAVEYGYNTVVEVLLLHESAGDQLKVVSKAGLNALELARENGHQAIVDLLAPLM